MDAFHLHHGTPSIGYLVREKPRRNVDIARLATMGLKPGPRLAQVKEKSADTDIVEVEGVHYRLGDLRQQLIVETAGKSIAYLTDFLLDDEAMDFLSSALRDCHTIVCEGQYRHSDLKLARKNFHSTTLLAATLAHKAQADELVLFHLSERYEPSVWLEMLEEAREVFPNTRFPVEWNLSGVN